MKFSLSLLALAAVVLTLPACNTLVTRRDLYSPSEGSGYWSKKYATYHEEHEGIFGVSRDVAHPYTEKEGIFGISHSVEETGGGANPDEGIFGISRNRD